MKMINQFHRRCFAVKLFLCGWQSALTVAISSSPTVAAESTPAQQAYIKASNTGRDDQFGFSVAVSADTMVVGAPYENSNATGVNGDQNDNSGFQNGAAYVFVRSGTNWTQQAYLKGSNTEAGDFFGYAVAISDDTIVVGAYAEDSSASKVNGNGGNNLASASGAAYVFVRSGTSWTQQAYLKPSNTEAGDLFGFSVAVSGDTVVVGAQRESSNATGVNGNQSDNNSTDAGAAYAFVRDGTNWSQQAYLKASNTGAGDRFGWSLAVSGNTVVIGSIYEASNATGVNGNESNNSALASGAAYVFVRSGTNWSQQAYFKASNTESSDRFGYSLALSGETVVVGALAESSNATGVNGNQYNNNSLGSGAAYIFVRSETNWSQQAYLKASNTDANDLFGCSVAVSGDVVVVGADTESSYATGVNGDESDNSALSSGAAYVFARDGTNWSQLAYLKASNTGTDPVRFFGDQFGRAVAIASDTVIVGAIGESSNATGVNGDQTDNSTQYAGAAYVFAGLKAGLGSCSNPQLTIVPAGYFIRFNAVAGCTYQLQRSFSVTGSWSTVATKTALASGLIEFHDPSPRPGQTFYRTMQP